MRMLPILLALGLSAVAAHGQTAATAPPTGARVLLTVTGVGVQIYTCRVQTNGSAWTFVGPQARLLDAHGAEVGSHGAGPMWTLTDGSSVKGQVLATESSADASSVPWLLLKAVEAKGPGTLGRVAYIRRSETAGGKARTTGCDPARLGAIDKVPYKATYTFYAEQ